MRPFNIVAGLDNATLNAYLAQVYDAIYSANPSLLSWGTTVWRYGTGRFDLAFAVQGPPTAILTPSTAAREYVEQLLATPPDELATLGGLAPEARAALAEAAAGASFDVSVPVLVQFLEGDIDSGTITFTLQVHTSTASGQNYLKLQAHTARVSIPSGNPVLIEVANWVMPDVVNVVNERLLSPFLIPALQFRSLTVSMPVPVVRDGFLLAYSALGWEQPDAPGSGDWPAGTLFAGVDSAVLAAAANMVLPQGTSSGFSLDAGPVHLSGNVGVEVPRFTLDSVRVNDDGSLTVQASCNARAQLGMRTDLLPFLPTFYFGPNATATVTVTARAAVVNGEVRMTLIDPPVPSFTFDLGSIPWWAVAIEAPLRPALASLAARLAGEVLRNFSFSVYTIPTFSVSLGGSSYDIRLLQATPSGCPSPQGRLLQVQARVSFTNPSAPSSIRFPSPTTIRCHDGKFLTAVDGGGLGGHNTPIETDRTRVREWETFTVETINAEAGKFALRAYNGDYVCAANGGGIGGPNDASCPVHTDATGIGVWDQFTMLMLPGGKFAIRTLNGHYLAATNGGGMTGGPVDTDRKAAREWETFTAVRVP